MREKRKIYFSFSDERFSLKSDIKSSKILISHKAELKDNWNILHIIEISFILADANKPFRFQQINKQFRIICVSFDDNNLKKNFLIGIDFYNFMFIACIHSSLRGSTQSKNRYWTICVNYLTSYAHCQSHIRI